jgi:hypothetical protein
MLTVALLDGHCLVGTCIMIHANFVSKIRHPLFVHVLGELDIKARDGVAKIRGVQACSWKQTKCIFTVILVRELFSQHLIITFKRNELFTSWKGLILISK